MKKRTIFLGFMSLLIFGISSLAYADLMTATFSSTELGNIVVTSASYPNPIPGITAGAPVQLTVSWDSATPDSNPDPQIGVYHFTELPSSLSILVNGITFAHSYNQGDLTVTVYNDSLSSIWGNIDKVLFSGKIDGPSPNYFVVGFDAVGKDGKVLNSLSSDSLPTIEELNEFPYIAGRVDVYPPGATTNTMLGFRNPTPYPAPVPLPPTVLLLGSGLLGLAGWGRLRKS